jgi:crotonobetainyl-CoA:carnitine CoA-transferase CaiB-like acyl-CoA transferase
MEAGVQQTYWQAAIFFATGVSPAPTGSAHILAAPYQAFPTRDGWINIGGANQANWERLTKLVGMPDLAEDPRFKANADRMMNIAALAAILAECLKTRTTLEWLEDLDAAGIPAGPINTVGEALTDPQVIARDMVVELNHPRAGRTKALGLPIKFSATQGGIGRPAPLFGEHTREILVELGYEDGDIAALVKAGAVAVA